MMKKLLLSLLALVVTNVAHATGISSTGVVVNSPEDDATVTIERRASLAVEKSVSNGATSVAVGEDVIFDVTVTNTGNVTLSNVTITDPLTGNENMVVVRDIPFSSMCEHHLLPFMGRAHICYLPRDGKVTGLSKLARCVNGYAHRPQLQERLTQQIADAVEDRLDPHGVLVVLQAEHSCMCMRGIKASGSLTVTSAVRGFLRTDAKAREEALRLIGMGGDLR
jgi:GTP cyclohydrolase I